MKFILQVAVIFFIILILIKIIKGVGGLAKVTHAVYSKVVSPLKKFLIWEFNLFKVVLTNLFYSKSKIYNSLQNDDFVGVYYELNLPQVKRNTLIKSVGLLSIQLLIIGFILDKKYVIDDILEIKNTIFAILVGLILGYIYYSIKRNRIKSSSNIFLKSTLGPIIEPIKIKLLSINEITRLLTDNKDESSETLVKSLENSKICFPLTHEYFISLGNNKRKIKYLDAFRELFCYLYSFKEIKNAVVGSGQNSVSIFIHSLNVTELVLSMVVGKNLASLELKIKDRLVFTCLSHDIGKIRSFNENKLSYDGFHKYSVYLLGQLNYFSQINSEDRDDVLSIVNNQESNFDNESAEVKVISQIFINAKNEVIKRENSNVEENEVAQFYRNPVEINNIVSSDNPELGAKLFNLNDSPKPNIIDAEMFIKTEPIIHDNNLDNHPINQFKQISINELEQLYLAKLHSVGFIIDRIEFETKKFMRCRVKGKDFDAGVYKAYINGVPNLHYIIYSSDNKENKGDQIELKETYKITGYNYDELHKEYALKQNSIKNVNQAIVIEQNSQAKVIEDTKQLPIFDFYRLNKVKIETAFSNMCYLDEILTINVKNLLNDTNSGYIQLIESNDLVVEIKSNNYLDDPNNYILISKINNISELISVIIVNNLIDGLFLYSNLDIPVIVYFNLDCVFNAITKNNKKINVIIATCISNYLLEEQLALNMNYTLINPLGVFKETTKDYIQSKLGNQRIINYYKCSLIFGEYYHSYINELKEQLNLSPLESINNANRTINFYYEEFITTK